MKARMKRIAYCMGSTLALSVFLTVPALADTNDNSQVVYDWSDKAAADVNTFANIRVDAGINSERVGRLPKGGVAEITGEKDGWIQVTSGEVEGYIRGDLLVSGEEAKALYVATYGSEEVSVEAEKIQAQPKPEVKETVKEAVNETADEQPASQEASASVAQSDLDLMAAIIECEAGGESHEGKIAVGAVIMNRINSSKFPNSLSEVIYEKGQFSPVASGKLSRVLSKGAREDCYQAARDVFAGANNIGDKLFFSAGSGKGIQIGNQHFY